MTDTNKALLESIKQMADDAPKVGICSMPFNVLYDSVAALVQENDQLKSECDRLMSIR